jgi:hypothetical protein
MGESRFAEPNPSNGGLSPAVQLALVPAQPRAVADALASLLEPPEPAADPWWQAGLDEILEP